MKKIILLGVMMASAPLLAFATSNTGATSTTPPTQSWVILPPRTGTGMEAELKGIHMAMAQLSATDREALIKMIKEYLVSKGIDPTKYAEKREEIKMIKKQTKEEIKASREKLKEENKAKREEMRNKVKDIRGKNKSSSSSGTTL